MMDIDLIVIFVGIAVSLMVTGISVTAIIDTVLSHKRKMIAMEQEAKAAPAVGLADRTDLIEDRLRVLERLATDRGTLLSDEIEALRAETPALSKSREAERG